MAKVRRIIRKVDTPVQFVIDEQFWPVILALFVLCGFLMGTVVAYLPFGAKHWWQDAKIWLFVIPVVTCVMVWLLRSLPSRVVRRALQVSIVLCLLFHVLMLVVSLESHIFGRLQEAVAQRPRRPQRELRIVNDYQPHQLQQHQRQQQDFVRPVETAVPDPVTENVERQEEQQERPQVDPQPVPAPQTPREIQRSAIERPTAAETRPRQGEQNSRLSRQTAEMQPKPAELISAPATATAAAASSTIEARAESFRQSAAQSQADRSQTTPDPATTALREAPNLARQATERAPETDSRSAPTLPRQVTQPNSVARVDVQARQALASARQTASGELEPVRTTTRQQLTASPNATQVVDPTIASATPVTNPTPQREHPSPTQPQLAQTPVSVANRQPRTTQRPDASSAAPTVAMDARPAANDGPSIEATSSTVSRADAAARAATSAGAAAVQLNAPASAASAGLAQRAAANPQPANVAAAGPTPRVASSARAANQAAAVAAPAQATSSEPSASLSLAGGSPGLSRQLSLMSAAGAATGPAAPASPAVAPSMPRTGERAASSSGAVADATANAVNHLPRTARRSEVASSTTLAETPRTVTADAGGDQPAARPTRIAMTQSLGGISGVGQTPNLDRSPSAPGSPSTTASGSARRAEATQNAPPGPALAPSATSLARRSLVGSDRPSASLRATANSVAEAAGSERPAELNATSGASLTRQAARATPGDTTAAKGSIDIDLGPTRVADAGGFERASGGGQPELNLDRDATNLARTRSGGSAPFALATTALDVSASSPLTSEQAVTNEIAGGSVVMQRADANSPRGSVVERSTVDSSLDPNAQQGNQVAASVMNRSDSPADMPSIGEPNGGSSAESEEERRRRLARSTGSPVAGSQTGPVAVPAAANVSEPTAEESTPLLASDSGGGIPRQSAAAENGLASPVGPMEQVAARAPAGGGNAVGEPTLARAEATDAVTGPAIPGGGTSGPRRSASGRALATNVRATAETLAGAPASSGSSRGADAPAQGVEPAPTATGALARATNDPVGAVASDMARDATPQAGMDIVAGIASRSAVNGDAPAVADGAVSGAPVQRSGPTHFNSGPVTAATPSIPSSPMSIAADDSNLKEAAMGTGASTARQQSAAALPIEVAAIDGAGGLGERFALDLGVSSRLATPDSIDVQTTPSRFIRQEIGGAPELNTSAVYSTDAFRNRTPGRSGTPMRGGAGTTGPQTEEAIELGLSYLVRRQLSDGSWTLRSTTEPVQLASDTAATGLCLLAFQGAGYSHREHRYATQVSAGIDYLVKNQKPDGDLFVPLDDLSNRSVWLYSHGIAAIALCEAYGMTHDPELREPAQKALDFIVATQDPKRGGWRYQPGIESDTSVTGWMMMALRSGELAGLKVPQSTYDHIGRWLDTAQGSADERFLYRYNPFAPDTDTQRHGRAASPTMSAVGLLMRLYGGWRRDHPSMISGAEYLRQNLPAIGTTREPLRDTYYWYYGTQVMFHMGGALWEEWNGQLHPLLIESQIKQGESAGSWSPRSPVPDRWAPHAGRLYVTTMNLLSLEVTYRHLPLYVETGK